MLRALLEVTPEAERHLSVVLDSLYAFVFSFLELLAATLAIGFGFRAFDVFGAGTTATDL